MSVSQVPEFYFIISENGAGNITKIAKMAIIAILAIAMDNGKFFHGHKV